VPNDNDFDEVWDNENLPVFNVKRRRHNRQRPRRRVLDMVV
jgi:hypothetical protein